MEHTEPKRFDVFYRITVMPDESIDRKIEALCLEQSVELPADTLSKEIRDRIVGRVESSNQTDEYSYEVTISWPVHNIGTDVSQFLNILFGNISLKDGILVKGVDWDALPHGLFGGPKFGISSIRFDLSAHNRALSATALKPMGKNAADLGNLAYEFALGGIDIIKDDHGLSNQVYAPFGARLMACIDGVNRANEKTGHSSVYYPNITADGDELLRRYEMAIEAGAGGVLVIPQLIAPDRLIVLSRHPQSIPVMAHPAFSGVYTYSKIHGFSKSFLYSELWRAMGADLVIYPNAGGRFGYTLQECEEINLTARVPLSDFKSIWPTPGGGIHRDTLPDWLQSYGIDTCFLIGGSLYAHPQGVRAAATEVREFLVTYAHEK